MLVILKVYVALSLVFRICEGASSSTFSSRRSDEWDAYIRSLKDFHSEKRELGHEQALTWLSDDQECSNRITQQSNYYYMYDTLMRRHPSGGMSTFLSKVQDQGMCGNCWAFAAVHTLTDHRRISVENAEFPLLSADHLTICDNTRDVGEGNGNGCCGARLHAGPEYIVEHGAIADLYMPAEEPITKTNLGNKIYRDGECSEGFATNTPIIPESNDIGYEVLDNDDDIKNALDDNKVVLAGMDINDEFLRCYKCGVYQQVNMTLPIIGQHAVEIVDYGPRPDSGTGQPPLPEFWVVKNSMGSGIHEKGYFRIKKGELNIGVNKRAMSFILSDGSTKREKTTDPDFKACGATVVRNPKSNMLVMCSVNYTLQKFKISADSGQVNICCDGRESAIDYDKNTLKIKLAETYIVSGYMVEFNLTVDVLGCGNKTNIEISGTVIVDNQEEYNLTQNYSAINKCYRSIAQALLSESGIIILSVCISITYYIVFVQ